LARVAENIILHDFAWIFFPSTIGLDASRQSILVKVQLQDAFTDSSG